MRDRRGEFFGRRSELCDDEKFEKIFSSALYFDTRK